MLQTDSIDPAGFLRALRTPGAVAYPLLGAAECRALADEARGFDFEAQPEAVGPEERRVHQRLASVQMGAEPGPFRRLVQSVEALVAGVHRRCDTSPWQEAPAFNDFLLQRYPPGPFALTPHLDGKRYRDLVVVAVFAGTATFCVCADRAGNGRVEIPAPPGSVIFMRAPGFDGAEDNRPFHCVLDVIAERYTLGMRCNSRLRDGAASAGTR